MAAIQKNFPNLLMVNVPVGYLCFTVFTKDLQFQVTGWESLRPYRIGFIRGVRKIEENTQGMRVEPVTKLEQAFKKLQIGRSDLVIDAPLNGMKMLNKLGFKDIRFLEPPLEREPLYHYLHTRHANLVPLLEQTLTHMEQEGVIQTIRDQVMQELLNKK
ncbi:MAG: transporter substrate-binding domain-containing protein [Desulfobacteraceae bacterium]|nr:transporter substrate-binding domain-containing protein [Desulfobacteraceae bacterium]